MQEKLWNAYIDLGILIPNVSIIEKLGKSQQKFAFLVVMKKIGMQGEKNGAERLRSNQT